jgi:DNA gyrase subunit A
MVNKSTMLEKIADMVRDKKLEGISDLRDESNRHGMRVVIELKKDAVAEVVKNNLYKYSQLQDTFGINNMVIVKKRPVMVNLKDLIVYYIEHRHEIVVRRTQHDLKKSQDRAHILEGLRIAQHNIEEVIRIIRGSSSPDLAKESLRSAFGLSEIQAQAIVDMRLRSITGLEIDKIENEYRELTLTIADFEDILANKSRRMSIVQARLDEIVVKYGDERRTTIEDSLDDFEIEDLIPDEEQVITLSKEGYIRRVSIDTFKAQGRGGKGVQGAGLKNDDLIETIITASTHSALLIFTNRGRMHWTKVYKLPEGSRTGKGRPIINFLELVENEKVSAIVPVRKYAEGFCLMMVTRFGTINKMDLALFSRPRRAGINAIVLNEGDELVSVLLAKDDGAHNVMIATRKGQAIAFPPSSFRSMGRGTRGVRGIRLEDGDTVIGMIMPEPTQMVLTLTEKGYAKRTAPDEYRVTNRGGKGVRNVQITDKTGEAVNVAAVLEDYDVIITSKQGQVIRIGCDTIRITGRDAQGVMAIRLYEGDAVMDMVALPSVEDIEKASEESQQAFAAAKEVELSEEDLTESENASTPEPEDDLDKPEE